MSCIEMYNPILTGENKILMSSCKNKLKNINIKVLPRREVNMT